MILFYTRAQLLLRRPPCWNKPGAARTTRHVTTRTTRRACRVVTQQVDFDLCERFAPQFFGGRNQELRAPVQIFNRSLTKGPVPIISSLSCSL